MTQRNIETIGKIASLPAVLPAHKEVADLGDIGTLEEFNIALITVCSLRFDSMADQWDKLATLGALGNLHKAVSVGGAYTPTCHTGMFLGHFPTAAGSGIPFVDERKLQPFRVTTGPTRDAQIGAGMLLQGPDIITGFRRQGRHVLGIGGVSQWSEKPNGDKSFLRTAFPWSEFRFFGRHEDEEPLAPREKNNFPLDNTEEIFSLLSSSKKNVLFMNLPNCHYPYDGGEQEDITKEIQTEIFPLLNKKLNLRTHQHSLTDHDDEQLFAAAPKLHEMQKKQVRKIDTQLADLLHGLQLHRSKRDWLVMFMGDHGENFGEERRNLATGEVSHHWGHMHPTEECLVVPMIVGLLSAISGEG